MGPQVPVRTDLHEGRPVYPRDAPGATAQNSGARGMALGSGMAVGRKDALELGGAGAGVTDCRAGRACRAAARSNPGGDANLGSRPVSGFLRWAAVTPAVHLACIAGAWRGASAPVPRIAKQEYARRDAVNVSSWFHDLTSLTRKPDIPTRHADRNARGVLRHVGTWLWCGSSLFVLGSGREVPGLNRILYEAKRPFDCRFTRATAGRSAARCWPGPVRRYRR